MHMRITPERNINSVISGPLDSSILIEDDLDIFNKSFVLSN